ncbi:MAG: hypothetical protein KKH83_06835 [Candidatus Margulisbacteria bacterium]|nr:hypothetical protein [Candidatus Margulisiibacteriota bacterium]
MHELAVTNEIARKTGNISTNILKIVSDLLDQELLWKIYEQTFNDIPGCAQQQMCYDERSFKCSLFDPEYIKFVIKSGNTPIGLSLATNNLAKARVSYMNPQFFENKYPIFYKKQKIYYVTALCISPEHQNLKYIKALLHAMTCFIIENDSMVSFDFSENKNSLLPKIIKMIGENLGIPITGEKLDTQTYFELHGALNSKPE